MRLELSVSEDDANDIDQFEAVYPGGVLPSAEGVIQSALNGLINRLHKNMQWRYETSVTCAMRWPWSMETLAGDGK